MINYDLLAEARAEYENALELNNKIEALRVRQVGHRRSAIRMYKAAGLSNRDIRKIMLIGEDDD